MGGGSAVVGVVSTAGSCRFGATSGWDMKWSVKGWNPRLQLKSAIGNRWRVGQAAQGRNRTYERGAHSRRRRFGYVPERAGPAGKGGQERTTKRNPTLVCVYSANSHPISVLDRLRSRSTELEAYRGDPRLTNRRPNQPWPAVTNINHQ